MKQRVLFKLILTLGALLALLVAYAGPQRASAQEGSPYLVAYWPFDEISGGTAHDSIGANDAALFGPGWAEGRLDGGLHFDGVEDYALVPDAPELDPANITIEAWIKLEAPAESGGVAIVEKGGWNGGQTGYAFLVGNWGVPNSLRFEVYPSWRSVTSLTGLSLGQWYHVAASFDGIDLKVFINGELDNSLSAPGPINVGNNAVLGIGARFEQNDINWAEISQDLNGSLDALAIYNQALSEEDIRQDYQSAFGASLAASTTAADIYPLPDRCVQGR